VITILATIVVLGVLIFVHELGHFATAKWMGISVPRFSIGLGPKMFGFQRGETEYVISWLPLGGYVKMAGMDDMEALEGESHDATEARLAGRDFESKSIPARALVLA
jgi:regulator of sigma E protease